MNKSIKYNIKLSINTLKEIFKYFDMDKKNTVIKLPTRNESVLEAIKKYKKNIIDIREDNGISYIYLKDMDFGELYYFLSQNLVFNTYYYKVKEKSVYATNSSLVCVHVRLDKIEEITFNSELYDIDTVKRDFKKYKSVNKGLIILIILLIVGLIINYLGKR